MTELSALRNRLVAAASPEDVFGALAGTADQMLEQVKRAYRAMALVAHPDRSPGEPRLAEETFNLLETWRRRAEEHIQTGTYGSATSEPIVTRRGTYVPGKPLQRGDYFTLYRCTREDRPYAGELLLKIVRNPAENDLFEHEVERLQAFADLAPDAPAAGVRRYVPEFIDSFLASDGRSSRRAAIFGLPKRTVPLTTIRDAYPDGLDPRDAAWIFNRLLEGLWFLHRTGMVHGAVLPPSLWIDIDNHGLCLADWASAAPIGERLSIISNTFAAWYPEEVLAKRPATPATDIFLAARCLVDLLGGDPLSGTLPAVVPASIKRFIAGCLVPWSNRRPSDAGELREEFGSLLKQLYGKPAFRPLAIPA